MTFHSLESWVIASKATLDGIFVCRDFISAISVAMTEFIRALCRAKNS